MKNVRVKLSERRQRDLYRYYLTFCNVKSMKEIGKEFYVSEATASKIISNGLKNKLLTLNLTRQILTDHPEAA